MLFRSTARSVTTVPSALAKFVPSFFANTPQRINSPILGTMSDEAYDKNMASTHVLVRGCSSRGSSDWRHLHARNVCANMPKGIDSSIHHQFISCSNTLRMLSRSKSRYIQYRIAPPNIMGRQMFRVLRIYLRFTSC